MVAKNGDIYEPPAVVGDCDCSFWKTQAEQFKSAAIAHLRVIGELSRERDEVYCALEIDPMPYQVWVLMMEAAGWKRSKKGWINSEYEIAMTSGEAGAFFIAGAVPTRDGGEQ